MKKNDKIIHKDYGLCKVDEIIPDFGICIIPLSKEGLMLLSYQSGMPEGTALLETNEKLIKELNDERRD